MEEKLLGEQKMTLYVSVSTKGQMISPINGLITRTNIINGGTAVEIFYTHWADLQKQSVKIDTAFNLVEASKLSLEDEILKHVPETARQRIFQEELITSINERLTDFYAQKRILLIQKDNLNPLHQIESIIAIPNSVPFFSPDPYELYDQALNIIPGRTRMGTKKESVAFLAILMKDLINIEGYSIENAWKAICDDSEKLGNFNRDEDHGFRYGIDSHIDRTGQRCIAGKWYDLGNLKKVVVKDFETGKQGTSKNEPNSFLEFGGCFSDFSYCYPLSQFINPTSDGSFDRYSTAFVVADI